MIISKDHILREELKPTHFLLTCAYPPHPTILNIKMSSSTPAVTYYLNGYHIEKQTFIPLFLPSQTQANHSQPPSIRISTKLSVASHFLLSGHINIYPFLQNPLARTTILSISHKHTSQHNKIPYTVTHIHLHTYTGKHTRSSYTILLPPPNNSTHLMLVMLAT